MLIASLLFSLMGGFIKVLSQNIPSLEIVFFRSFFGFIIVLFLVYRSQIKSKGGKKFLLFLRAILGFFSILIYFYLISKIPLNEVATYRKMIPIFTAIFAYILLKEKLKSNVIISLFIGFSGIILVANPENLLSKYTILALLSSILASLAYISIRKLKNYYEAKTILLVFMGLGTLFSSILILISLFFNTSQHLDWLFSPFIVPKGVEWIYILLVVILSTTAQLFLTKAYLVSKAGVVGIVSYSSIIFSSLIGIFLGDPIPSFLTTIGIILVIISGVILTFRKK